MTVLTDRFRGGRSLIDTFAPVLNKIILFVVEVIVRRALVGD